MSGEPDRNESTASRSGKLRWRIWLELLLIAAAVGVLLAWHLGGSH